MGGTLVTWTAAEVATHLGVSVEEVQRLVDEGRLRTLPLHGGGWVTTETAVRAFSSPPRRRRRRRAPIRVVATPDENVATPQAETTTAPAPVAPVARKAKRHTPIDIRPDVSTNPRLDMRAAAEQLGVSADEALRLAQQGSLRASRLGREWVTTGRDVRAYLEAQRRRARKPAPRNVAAA